MYIYIHVYNKYNIHIMILTHHYHADHLDKTGPLCDVNGIMVNFQGEVYCYTIPS